MSFFSSGILKAITNIECTTNKKYNTKNTGKAGD